VELRGIVLGDRYRLERRIAAGGMGQVWRAYDEVLEREVAVKLLRPEYAEHPETLERFRAEARHAGALSHPHIAQVYDYQYSGLAQGPYLVMEYVNGPSLAELIARGPLTPDLTCDVIAQAAGGLDAAHQAGLVHRDIKPQNMLLTSGGQVKITDFGIAHAAGSAPITAPGVVMGTSLYMAPERIAGGPGTPASDLYSLGIVMWECLAGRPPFAGSAADVMAAHLHQAMPPLPGWVPGPLRDTVAGMTAKDPGNRVSDAGLLAVHVRSLQAAGAGTAAAGTGQVPGAGTGSQRPPGDQGPPRDAREVTDSRPISDLPPWHESPAAYESLAAHESRPFSPPAGYRSGAYLHGAAAPAVGIAPADGVLADSGVLAGTLHGTAQRDPVPVLEPPGLLAGTDRVAVDGGASSGTVPAAPARRTRRGRYRGRRRGARVVAAVVVAAGLGAAGLAVASGAFSSSPAAGRGASPGSAAGTAAPGPPASVLVPASLVGHRVGPVLSWLRAHGLNSDVEYAVGTGQPPGTVISLTPHGPVPPGTTIIVTVAASGTHGRQKAGPGSATTPGPASSPGGTRSAGPTPPPTGSAPGGSSPASPAPSSSPTCLLGIVCV
jgi:serine/threonine-protein kinase